MHLAELNISYPKMSRDDPLLADFVNNVDRINKLGESMPGFVWRFDDGEFVAAGKTSPWPDAFATLTVWESAEHLEHFVWNTVHKQFYNRKHEWFTALKAHQFVLWQVEEGHQPDYAEADIRLEHLNMHGDSDFAFGWSHLPHVKLWQTQQCG